MILADVNVLVRAYRADTDHHEAVRTWLQRALASDEAFGLSELVLGGLVRVVTHPRVFVDPAPVTEALAFANALRGHPTAVLVTPGARHWSIFERLCRDGGCRGNLVPDAYLAALAIEHGCRWITLDRDFSRFPGLRWSHPLS